MGADLMTETFLDTKEQDWGVTRGEELKFDDFGSEVVESSFRLVHIARLFDGDHTVGIEAVVCEGKGDLGGNKGGYISIDFCEVVFIEQKSWLHLFELFVDAGIFREIEETGGFVI